MSDAKQTGWLAGRATKRQGGFNWNSSGSLAAQAHHHVDAGDLHALRRLRQAAEVDQLLGQVDQQMRFLGQEMLVVGEIGVEIGPGAVHGDFAQQARRCELVQRVVDGGERNRRAGGLRFLKQPFGRDMTVAAPNSSQPRRRRWRVGRRPAASSLRRRSCSGQPSRAPADLRFA